MSKLQTAEKPQNLTVILGNKTPDFLVKLERPVDSLFYLLRRELCSMNQFLQTALRARLSSQTLIRWKHVATKKRESVSFKFQKGVFSQETRTIQVKKSETQQEGSKLSEADAKLINRNDFLGVKPMNEMVYKQIALETAICALQEKVHHNRRANAEYFMVHVLLPLESGSDSFKSSITRRPDFYVPLIFRFCGRVMTDLNKRKRTVLVKRVAAALERNEIPLSLSSFNALLETRLENDDKFDAMEMLKEVEEKRRLVPDLRFFNCLAWQYAKLGLFREFDNLMYEMKKRALSPDEKTERARIFCCERSGVTLKADSLVQRYVGLYGQDKEPEAMGAACFGAAAGQQLSRLRILLRKTVKKNSASDRYVLRIPQQSLFDVIFMLAENSVDGMGKEHMVFVQEILEHATREQGFFKLLFAESERHMNHDYFYTAITLVGDMFRVSEPLNNQNKGKFNYQLIGRLANRMVAARVDKSDLIELTNRLAAIFGVDIRFYDNIVKAILTYRHYTPMQKFEQFRAFADMIDPERERIHTILPLITSCADPTEKCKMLFRCINLGYTNVSDLSSEVMARQILIPLFEQFQIRYPWMSDVQRLQKVAEVIASYGVSMKNVWLIYFQMLRESRKGNLHIVFSEQNTARWLKERKNSCFPLPDQTAQERLLSMTYEKLRNLVLEEKKAEQVHSFLLQRGFPPETNFEEITEPLLYLYIENANWGYVQKLLQMLSQREPKISITPDLNFENETDGLEDEDEQPCFVKNYHLLRLIRRRLDELADSTTLEPIIDYAYELKRLFPTAQASNSTFFETIGEYRRLYHTLLTTPHTLPIRLPLERYQTSIELLKVLVRLNVISLHTNETLTPFIVHKVLRGLGWNQAVECWMNFQSGFNTSNGMIELLRFALRRNDTQKLYFVLHKARNTINVGKTNAFLAAACLLHNNAKKAEEIFEISDPLISALDVSNVFRFINAWVFARSSQMNNVGMHSHFPYQYMELALKYTNLREDEKGLELCHADWIRQCAKTKRGESAFRFLELFKQYGVQLEVRDIRLVYSLIQEHNSVIHTWITSPDTGLLNTDSLNDSETMNSIRTNEIKAEELREQLASANKLRERPSDVGVAAH